MILIVVRVAVGRGTHHYSCGYALFTQLGWVAGHCRPWDGDVQCPCRPDHNPRTSPLAMACSDTARARLERLPPIAASRVIHWQEITEADNAEMFSQMRSTRVLWTRPSADDGGEPASRISSITSVCFLPDQTLAPLRRGSSLAAEVTALEQRPGDNQNDQNVCERTSNLTKGSSFSPEHFSCVPPDATKDTSHE